MSLFHTWGTSLPGGRGMKALARRARTNRCPAAPSEWGTTQWRPALKIARSKADVMQTRPTSTNFLLAKPQVPRPLTVRHPQPACGLLAQRLRSFNVTRHPPTQQPASSPDTLHYCRRHQYRMQVVSCFLSDVPRETSASPRWLHKPHPGDGPWPRAEGTRRLVPPPGVLPVATLPAFDMTPTRPAGGVPVRARVRLGVRWGSEGSGTCLPGPLSPS